MRVVVFELTERGNVHLCPRCVTAFHAALFEEQHTFDIYTDCPVCRPDDFDFPQYGCEYEPIFCGNKACGKLALVRHTRDHQFFELPQGWCVASMEGGVDFHKYACSIACAREHSG